MGNKNLTCQDCGSSFTFTEEEQKFFEEKGFGEPKRCKDCRAKKKNDRNKTVFTDVICAECGSPAKVPFVPTRTDRPVLCKACFDKKKQQ